MWHGTGVCRFESTIIGPHIHLASIEQGIGHYRGWHYAAKCFHVCQRNGKTGPEALNWSMEDDCCFTKYVNGSVAYTIPSIDISYIVFSLWSDEKYPSNLLDTSLPFATGHVRSPFSGNRRLWCIWCEGERSKYSPQKYWMKRFFWSTNRCWRDSGLLLWDISLLKHDDAKAGSEKLMVMASCSSLWKSVLHRRSRFQKYV